MRKRAMVAVMLLGACAQIGRAEETVSPLKEEETPPILAVTGFHSVEDKANKLEIRLLEADSSGDVARNPVALFLVITDNAPANDSQTYIWRLPGGVSVVKKLTVAKNRVQILAVVDGQMDERTGRFPLQNQIISIAYSFAKGVLSDTIRVTTSKP